jgi:hypothetical protein
MDPAAPYASGNAREAGRRFSRPAAASVEAKDPMDRVGFAGFPVGRMGPLPTATALFGSHRCPLVRHRRGHAERPAGVRRVRVDGSWSTGTALRPERVRGSSWVRSGGGRSPRLRRRFHCRRRPFPRQWQQGQPTGATPLQCSSLGPNAGPKPAFRSKPSCGMSRLWHHARRPRRRERLGRWVGSSFNIPRTRGRPREASPGGGESWASMRCGF